jgi:hypothetical protein
MLSDIHLSIQMFGKQFIVRTDHGSLRWLLHFKNPEGQMARWLQVLSSYDMTIVHRPGRQHRNANALSRILLARVFRNPRCADVRLS